MNPNQHHLTSVRAACHPCSIHVPSGCFMPKTSCSMTLINKILVSSFLVRFRLEIQPEIPTLLIFEIAASGKPLQLANWKDPPFYSWLNPLNFHGHVPVRKLFVITRGFPKGKSSNFPLENRCIP